MDTGYMLGQTMSDSKHRCLDVHARRCILGVAPQRDAGHPQLGVAGGAEVVDGAVPGEGGHHGGQQGGGGHQELGGGAVVQLLPAVWVQGECTRAETW